MLFGSPTILDLYREDIFFAELIIVYLILLVLVAASTQNARCGEAKKHLKSEAYRLSEAIGCYSTSDAQTRSR